MLALRVLACNRSLLTQVIGADAEDAENESRDGNAVEDSVEADVRLDAGYGGQLEKLQRNHAEAV